MISILLLITLKLLLLFYPTILALKILAVSLFILAILLLFYPRILVLKIFAILSIALPWLSLFYPVGYFVLDKTSRNKFGMTVGEGMTFREGDTVAYIINLDSSKARYDYVEPKVKKLGFTIERISAVYGPALSEDELKTTTDFESFKKFFGVYPGKGEIGCSLSHMKAWRSFLDSGFEFALIFEDDVSFNPNHLLNIIELLKQEKNLWDIVSFDGSTSTSLTIKTFSNKYNLLLGLRGFSYAGAYLLKRDTAKKLLAKALPIKMPIDHYFSRAWELGINFNIIGPRIVSQSFGDSDIEIAGRTSNNENFTTSFFEFQSGIMKFFYGLKLYLNMLIRNVF